MAAGPDGAGERLLRTFLGVWDDPELQPGLLALARSLLADDSAGLVRDGFIPVVVGPVLAAAGRATGPRCGSRSSPARSIGLIVARYVIALPPLAQMPAEDVVARVGPVLQHYLTGDLP